MYIRVCYKRNSCEKRELCVSNSKLMVLGNFARMCMCIEFVIQVSNQKNAHVCFPVGMVILQNCNLRGPRRFSQRPSQRPPQRHPNLSEALRPVAPIPAAPYSFSDIFRATLRAKLPLSYMPSDLEPSAMVTETVNALVENITLSSQNIKALAMQQLLENGAPTIRSNKL